MRRSVSRFVTLGIALMVGTGSAAAVSTPTRPELADAVRTLIERFGGVATDYTELAEQNFTAGSAAIWTAKFFDSRKQTIRAIYRDDEGNTGGVEVWQAAVVRADVGKSDLDRKASKELADRVGLASPSETLPVAIWLDVDTTSAVASVIAAHPDVTWLGDRPSAADLGTQRSLRAELDAARSAVYKRAAEHLVGAIGDDGTVGYVSLLAPLAYVDVRPAAVPRLASLGVVRALELEHASWRESLASANPYVHGDWTTTTADEGTNVRVGVIEYYNVRKVGDTAGKVAVSHSMDGVLAGTPTGVFDHPTWVAGAIVSQSTTNTGIAPGAMIVSSSTGGGSAGPARDRDVISAADWAATTGSADIINLSVNMDSTDGRDEARAYFDALGGGESYRTVVASSGNYGSGVDAGWWVSSPGTGWNVLTVGGVNDGTDTLWYDGDPCPCSGAQWEEHLGVYYNTGDFNKPDVSAPAANVTTANGLSNSGTSVATPIVSGIAAQLFARDATFLVWPEAARAIIMASAAHQAPLPGGGISREHEGVGEADARAANRVWANGTTWGGWTKGTMVSTTPITQSFNVAAGKRVRAVLTWDSHTSGGIFDKSDTRTADLDLYATFPGGSASSITVSNTSEFVSFTATTSGTVTLSIHAPSFTRGSEPYALAWYIY